MRKKILIVLLGFLGTFSVAYAYQKMHIQATSKSNLENYYKPGENFLRTNTDTFTMKGMKWKIAYTNQITGEGYIIGENLTSKYSCSAVSLKQSAIDACMVKAQSIYESNAENDTIGEMITSHNSNLTELKIIDVASYDLITDHEKDFSYLDNVIPRETWFDDVIDGIRLTYYKPGGSSSTPEYSDFTYVLKPINSTISSSMIYPSFKVKLPQSNMISMITADKTEITKIYSEVKKGQIINGFTISSGEGPFQFYVYDTDTTGTYQTPSTYFELINNITSDDKVELKTKYDLVVGDYYFKVKVVDESTNTNLYHTPSDFTIDTYRSKETGVIHLKVEKGTQDPIKVYVSSSDQASGTNDQTSFSIDKTDHSITLYPAGGASEIANTEFTYEVISDPNSILSNTPGKGSSGTFTLSHSAGTASVKITKPGNSNYNDISTTIQITATSISDTPVITASDGTNPYGSASKSNQDITVTFNKGSNGSTVNKALKLKELSGNTTPSANWYLTGGTESTVNPGDTKALTASSTQTYVCYWLYYDGYLNEGVEFRVDLLKDTLKIRNPQTPSSWLADNDTITTSGNSFDVTSANHTLDSTKTKLYEQGNMNKTYPLTNVNEGLYTIHLEDAYGNETDIDFKVLASLYFVTPNTDTKITKDEITYEKDGIYKVQAKGSTNTIKYRVADGNPYLEATSTDGEFKLLKTGTVEIEAYTEDGSGNTLSSVKINVTIKKADQTLAFDDTNLTKRVRKGSASFLETATGALTASKKPGVGGITYSSSAPSIITIDPDTGEVTVGNTGTATITAVLNDPKSSTYDANYETKTITKTIEVYEGMSVTFTPSSLQAEKTATLNATAGTLTPSNNNGSVSYKISSSTDPKNVDASWFKLNGSTLQLSKAVSGSDLSKHVGGNTFKVQIDVTDQDGTVTVDCEITISDAENDFYFVNPNNVTEKITSISEAYGIGKTIQLQTHTSNGKPVTYKLKDGQDSSNISIAQDGTVTILKAGGPIKAEATVSAGSGYAGKTIELSITITASTQTIAFDKATNESIQFVKDTSYATPATLKEADGTQSTRLIQYSSETTSICTIDSTGNITMLTIGDCKIKAENKDHNYTSVSTSKTITLYDGMGGNFTQGTTPQAEETNAQSGSPIGSVSVSGGQGTKTYSVSSNTQDNSEKDFFTITSAGVVSLNKNITASDLASLSQDHDGNYIMHVVFTAKDALNNTVEIKAEIKVKGAKLNAEFDTGGTGMITKPYSPNGTFLTEIINNKGNGTPVYRLKTGNDIPADVLQQIDSGTGIVTIENAVEGTKYAYIQAEIPASGGYCAATIEVPVNITKAEQDFKFKKKVINLQTESSMELEVEGILSKQADGTLMDWTMASQDTSLVKVNGHSITGTKKEGSTTITASVKGDRNYKAGSDTITINVSSAPAYDFSITVPNATYGDTGLIGEVFTDEGIGANKKQVWTSSDESVAIIDPDTGELTIIKAGKTTITCTQTSDGEPSVSATATFVIDPKPISITIDDATKKVGEALPQFNAMIDPDELVGSDTIDQPIFSCKDRDNKSITNLSPAGEYEITGSYPTGANPNYEITVTPGKLTVTQEESNDTWFALIGKETGEVIPLDTWVNESVYVSLKKTESDPYDQISLNQKDWDGEHILVDTEGITTTDVFFKQSNTNALSTSQSTTIKIDQTAPVITSISGHNGNSTVRSILNTLTLGQFFKPGMVVTIEAQDPLPEGITDPTMVSGVEKITYEITKLDETGKPIGSPNTMDQKDTSVEVSLKDAGTYQVCATATDGVGRVSAQKCERINIRKWGESSGENEIPDINIDIDNDGIPDINITRPGEKKPYLNIDTDGDGAPDINISKQGEEVIPGTTEPYLNIMDPRVKWNPAKEIDFDGDGEPDFRIDESLSAIISIDSNGDDIPDLNIDLDEDYVADLNIDVNGDKKTAQTNIDTNGDRKPDINIDVDGDGTPDSMISTKYEWNPTYLVKDKEGNVLYGTTEGIKNDTIDSVTDQGFIVKPSDNTQQFLPNYALKVSDVTDSISETKKEEIINSSKKENYEVAGVYEIALKNNEEMIQPDGSVEVSIPYDQAWGDVILMKKNEHGDWEEVSVEIVGGYLKFTTDYIGEVSILKQKSEDHKDDPEPEPEPTPADPDPIPTDPEPTPADPDIKPNSSSNNNNDSSLSQNKPSVQGTYTPYSNTAGMGGASTGDTTNLMMLLGTGWISLTVFLFLLALRHKKES